MLQFPSSAASRAPASAASVSVTSSVVRAKAGADDAIGKARHDAAADENAAARAEGEREVAGEAAEEGGEEVERVPGQLVAMLLCGGDDLRRRHRGADRHAAHRRQRRVQQHQPRAGEQPLGRNMRVFAPHVSDHFGLQCVGSGQGCVAAFGRQRLPAVASAQHGSHAEARAGTEDGEHGAAAHLGRGPRRRAAKPSPLRGSKAGQGPRQRLEVVDNDQLRQGELAPQRFDRERPGAVGEADRVAGDRRGHGQGGARRGLKAGPELALQTLQIGLHRLRRAAMGRHRQGLHLFDSGLRVGDPGQARVGAADVGQQQGVGAARRTHWRPLRTACSGMSAWARPGCLMADRPTRRSPTPAGCSR
ncbi:MAG: hypothetical protein ABS84_02935 [Rubrivivax sp. SCN 71-131]|nr:MAG: hypothetical protein ABS84_02935 [Rubrivivax sp. SCN 71-131]